MKLAVARSPRTAVGARCDDRRSKVEDSDLRGRLADQVAVADDDLVILCRCACYADSTAQRLDGRREGLRGLRMILGPFVGDADWLRLL
jgi:hypothetical protein